MHTINNRELPDYRLSDREVAATHFVFVRHGQTEGNNLNLLHGSTDLPLSETGKQQAKLVGDRIRARFSFDLIVSSPLLRAASTAAEITKGTTLEIRYDPGLREIDFGDYENLPIGELLARHPEFLSGGDRSVDFTWPNGDTLSSFHHGVTQTFAALQRAHSGSTIVVVTHGGFLGSLFASVNDVSPNNWQAYRFANCSISTLVAADEGVRVTAMNDVDHLAALGTFDD